MFYSSFCLYYGRESKYTSVHYLQAYCTCSNNLKPVRVLTTGTVPHSLDSGSTTTCTGCSGNTYQKLTTDTRIWLKATSHYPSWSTHSSSVLSHFRAKLRCLVWGTVFRLITWWCHWNKRTIHSIHPIGKLAFSHGSIGRGDVIFSLFVKEPEKWGVLGWFTSLIWTHLRA